VLCCVVLCSINILIFFLSITANYDAWKYEEFRKADESMRNENKNLKIEISNVVRVLNKAKEEAKLNFQRCCSLHKEVQMAEDEVIRVRGKLEDYEGEECGMRECCNKTLQGKIMLWHGHLRTALMNLSDKRTKYGDCVNLDVFYKEFEDDKTYLTVTVCV